MGVPKFRKRTWHRFAAAFAAAVVPLEPRLAPASVATLVIPTTTVHVLGAAGTVTGSKHLVSGSGGRVLLDCGLFQGLKALRERKWRPFPFDPATLDAVVLSHAHIDHSGALPLLVRRGFRGPIHCTPATADLLKVLLLDAAHLQEEDAEFANRAPASSSSTGSRRTPIRKSCSVGSPASGGHRSARCACTARHRLPTRSPRSSAIASDGPPRCRRIASASSCREGKYRALTFAHPRSPSLLPPSQRSVLLGSGDAKAQGSHEEER